MKNKFKTRYCGKDFTHTEFEIMRRIIAEDPSSSRAQISRRVCEELAWYKPDGGLKEMSCRVAMIRMHEDGLLILPPPRKKRPTVCIKITPATAPQSKLAISANNFSDIQLEQVDTSKKSALWNEYIQRYHYLGYTPLAGAQLRYMVSVNGQYIAMFGFSAAAWKTSPRDVFIGWNDDQRQKGLPFIVNNSRFLILPWVKIKNLASKLLSLITKQLPDDWEMKYRYKPVLLETFVDERFHGTCYRAANWIHVGQTKGRGKLGSNNANIPKKRILLYPLTPRFRQILTQPLS